MKQFLLTVLCTIAMTFLQAQLVLRVDVNIVEMAEKDVKDYGIEQSVVYNMIQEQLTAANMRVSNEPNLPRLLLHIKSLPADHSIATIVQGSFYEEAVSNKKPIWAITWSQTGIVTGPKDQYIKNVQGEVNNIVNSFILDYQTRSKSG